MSLIDIKTNENALWIICAAIKDQSELLGKMEHYEEDKKILYDVKFSVGGIELNFQNVVEAIMRNYTSEIQQIETKYSPEAFNRKVSEKVNEILKERYSKIMDDLSDIQMRIEDHKEIFPY